MKKNGQRSDPNKEKNTPPHRSERGGRGQKGGTVAFERKVEKRGKKRGVANFTEEGKGKENLVTRKPVTREKRKKVIKAGKNAKTRRGRKRPNILLGGKTPQQKDLGDREGGDPERWTSPQGKRMRELKKCPAGKEEQGTKKKTR